MLADLKALDEDEKAGELPAAPKDESLPNAPSHKVEVEGQAEGKQMAAA